MKEELERLLRTRWAGRRIVYEPRMGSTNDRARELAEQGAPEGTAVIAGAQDAGRGRQGRAWLSPPGTGLFMSVILRPDIDPARIPMITLAAALAVREGIRDVSGLEPLIKWPNDIVSGGKKICGILTEARMKGRTAAYVVTGIGINVNVPGFPPELSEIASSIRLETGKEISLAETAAAVCGRLEEMYETFCRTGDMSALKETYNQLMAGRGCQVRILAPEGAWEGEALGISVLGELLVRRRDGQIAAVTSGEVSVRGMYGYV